MAKRDKMIYFDDLQRVRKARGVSLKRLGRVVGIGPAQMGEIERGESGTPRVRAQRIAGALYTSLRALGAFRRVYI
jgi:transcriptional regulator with XRE-family HTH domain